MWIVAFNQKSKCIIMAEKQIIAIAQFCAVRHHNIVLNIPRAKVRQWLNTQAPSQKITTCDIIKQGSHSMHAMSLAVRDKTVSAKQVPVGDWIRNV